MQREVILIKATKPELPNSNPYNLKLSVDIFIIITGIAAVIGVMVAYYQLGKVIDSLQLQKQEMEQQKQEMKVSLDRVKRENAINYTLRWNNLRIEAHSASRFVELLSSEDAKKLLEFEEIEIEEKNNGLKFLRDIFGEDYDFKPNNGKIKLQIKQVKKLRYYTLYWINTLESIFIAYRYDVADKKILMEEFENVVFDNTHKFVLNNLFKEAGKERKFPGISQFIQDVQEKYKLGNPANISLENINDQ